MVAMFGLVDAPELTRYVNLVGQAVAQFAPRQIPYRFGILDSDIVGAFALPGGYIFITRTAINGMHDEAELAGVLGHEILHVSERHLELAIRGRKASAWAVEEARTKTVGDKEFIRQRADVFVKEMFDLGVSREKEEAADQQGTLMAAQAGYVPDGLLQFLRSMQSAETNSPRTFGQLRSTHPPFADRIAYLTPIVDRAGHRGQTLEERFTAALQ
jgi:predicted Zn-dependent protease